MALARISDRSSSPEVITGGALKQPLEHMAAIPETSSSAGGAHHIHAAKELAIADPALKQLLLAYGKKRKARVLKQNLGLEKKLGD